jgi:hypothetical protein
MIDKRKQIVIIGTAVLFCLISIGLIVFALIRPAQETSSSKIYNDPGSGEMVYDNSPLNQSAVDNPGESSLTYLGFSFLSDIGLTQQQIATTKDAVAEYAGQQSEPVKEVSLDKSSVRQTMSPNGSTTVTRGVITVNRTQTRYMTIEFDINTFTKVTIYNKENGQVLFTKG